MFTLYNRGTKAPVPQPPLAGHVAPHPAAAPLAPCSGYVGKRNALRSRENIGNTNYYL